MLNRYFQKFLQINEDALHYRLTPSELNWLLRHLVKETHPHAEIIRGGYLKIRVKERNFVIFPMSKDSKNPDNEPTLQYFGKMLEDYYRRTGDQDSILLMPIRFCRGFLKCPTWVNLLKRKHGVLMEIDLQNQTIQIHNSQKRSIWYYPDAISEHLSEMNHTLEMNLKYDSDKDHHHYDMQHDEFSCGYYVYRYIRFILDTGSSKGCERVIIDIKSNFKDKKDYLTQKKIFPSEDTTSDTEELSKDALQKLFDSWCEIKIEDVRVPIDKDWEFISDSAFCDEINASDLFLDLADNLYDEMLRTKTVETNRSLPSIRI